MTRCKHCAHRKAHPTLRGLCQICNSALRHAGTRDILYPRTKAEQAMAARIAELERQLAEAHQALDAAEAGRDEARAILRRNGYAATM